MTIIKRSGLLAVILLLCVVASRASFPQTILRAERGSQIAAKWCTARHSTGSSSQASDVGPSFYDIARRRSPDYVRGFLANPHVRGSMPRSIFRESMWKI
jgi:hypothetical protein